MQGASGRPLTVGEAGLPPAALLNFAWRGPPSAAGNNGSNSAAAPAAASTRGGLEQAINLQAAAGDLLPELLAAAQPPAPRA